MKKLFFLIKSLNKGEKRVFTRYAQGLGSKSSNYLDLFNLINNQIVENESIIIEKFNKKATTKNWGAMKERLYNLIIKSMRVVPNESVENQLINGLKDFDFLYSKQMYHYAQRKIREIKKIAIQNDQILYLPIIYKKELELERYTFNYVNYNLASFEAYTEVYTRLMDSVHTYSAYLLIENTWALSGKKSQRALKKYALELPNNLAFKREQKNLTVSTRIKIITN